MHSICLEAKEIYGMILKLSWALSCWWKIQPTPAHLQDQAENQGAKCDTRTLSQIRWWILSGLSCVTYAMKLDNIVKFCLQIGMIPSSCKRW